MHIKTHDKTYSVVLEDGSEWKIWPADLAAALQWGAFFGPRSP
jgi:hypothetical protein